MRQIGLILMIIACAILAVTRIFPTNTSFVFASTTTKSTVQITFDVEDKVYDIKVIVTDQDENMIEGAKVTLYSNPIEKYTDHEGVAMFEDILPGEHRLVIEYENQTGEHKILLKGEAEIYEFHITIESTHPFSQIQVQAVIGILVLLVIFAVAWGIKERRKLHI